MLRESPVKTAVTFEQFLEFESHSQERHEFVDGNLFVMPGGTDRHNHVMSELHALIRQAVRHAGYRAYITDMLLQTPGGAAYYPDVFVTPIADHDSARVKHSPIVIFEVLSKSTETFDRGEKWQTYQTIPSLEQYVLLSQDEPIAEVFSRLDDGSWRYKKLGSSGALKFSSFQFELALEELYRDLPPI